MNRDLKKVREQASRYLMGKVVQAEGTTRANVLRQSCALCLVCSRNYVGSHCSLSGVSTRESRERRAGGVVMPGFACHLEDFGFYTECFGKALEGSEQRSDPTIKGPLRCCVENKVYGARAGS